MALEEVPAGQKLSVMVRNQRGTGVTFVLEPYGSTYTMAPGAVFEVRAEGPAGDHLEIDFEEDAIIAWAWAGSIAEVYESGVPLSSGRPTRVPTALPEGMRVRGFLRMVMGDSQQQGGGK
jgi:hypothetical protein